MKISALIICLLTLGLGAATYVYTSNQETTMKMVIGASGGVDDANPTGLRLVNKGLDVEVAAAAKERQEALKASQDALVLMQMAAENKAKAEKGMNEATSDRDDMVEKVKDMEARAEEVHAQERKMLEFLRSLPSLGEDVDLGTAVEKLRSVVEEEAERNRTLTASLEEKTTLRKAATERAASTKAESERLEGINKDFFVSYTKNEIEYPVLAVDTRWKFVVFNVGEDSGLIVGDSTPMLVRRGDDAVISLRIVSISGGQVIAEYKKEHLPAGVQIQVGDMVFREKPAGS